MKFYSSLTIKVCLNPLTTLSGKRSRPLILQSTEQSVINLLIPLINEYKSFDIQNTILLTKHRNIHDYCKTYKIQSTTIMHNLKIMPKAKHCHAKNN